MIQLGQAAVRLSMRDSEGLGPATVVRNPERELETLPGTAWEVLGPQRNQKRKGFQAAFDMEVLEAPGKKTAHQPSPEWI